MRQRWRIMVEGTVQGVGFRPFVYDLATKKGLAGFVHNDVAGVLIEVEGESSVLVACLRSLQEEAPLLVSITHLVCEVLSPTGDLAFTIAHSEAATERRAHIAPDTCPCDDCLRELLDPHDRRYRYAFLNCTRTVAPDSPSSRMCPTIGSAPPWPTSVCATSVSMSTTARPSGVFMPNPRPALTVALISGYWTAKGRKLLA